MTYYSPHLGLLGIMDHYQAESIPLDRETWMMFNDTLYQYWNPIEEEFQSINISLLFRSDYSKITEFPMPPLTTNYTVISLGTSFATFWAMFLAYSIMLAVMKYFISNEFKRASFWEKLQNVIEALNIPEAYDDWDTDNELDLDGHLQKWKKVLSEMMLMVFMQLITNLMLLVPFFVAGTSKLFGYNKIGSTKTFFCGFRSKMCFEKNGLSFYWDAYKMVVF